MYSGSPTVGSKAMCNQMNAELIRRGNESATATAQ